MAGLGMEHPGFFRRAGPYSLADIAKATNSQLAPGVAADTMIEDVRTLTDAGPRHLAKAFDVPVVTVFGPTHPDWTSTSYAKERIVRIDVDCGPCQQRVCPLEHHQCMTGVTVDMVFAAAATLLQTYATQHAELR